MLDVSGYTFVIEKDLVQQAGPFTVDMTYMGFSVSSHMARHYKPALPRQKALGILWKEAQAGRIDQGLVELLDQHIETVEADCEALPERLDFAEYLARPLPVVA